MKQVTEAGSYDDAMRKINPDFTRDENFNHWLQFQSSRRASGIIEILQSFLT